jgi:hypothetical protein
LLAKSPDIDKRVLLPDIASHLVDESINEQWLKALKNCIDELTEMKKVKHTSTNCRPSSHIF